MSNLLAWIEQRNRGRHEQDHEWHSGESVAAGAFILALVAAVGAILRVIGIALRDPSYLFAELIACAIALVAIAVGYGLLLRLLGLCDDISALRRARAGTLSSLDSTG